VVKTGEMLIGHYFAKIGTKGRTALPKKYRQELGDKVILARWYENCLVVVGVEIWLKLAAEIAKRPFMVASGRETDRFLSGGAFEIELDKQGRLVIPESLRGYADLKEDIIFIGLGNRVEIWDEDKWGQYEKYLDEHAEEIAERLGGVGI
jgi:MraZ protein